MQQHKWQQLVVEDDNQKIKCLCGRQVGASTLVPLVSMENCKTAVFHKYGSSKDYMNRAVNILSDFSVKIKSMKGHMNSTLKYTANGYLPRTLQFFKYIDQPGYQIERGKPMDYDAIIFDNIEPENAYQLEGFIDEVKKHKPEVQVYVLISTSDTEYKWYVIPSVNGNLLADSYYEDMKISLPQERYHQDILAGLILPDELISDDRLKLEDPERVKARKIFRELQEDLNSVLDKYVGEEVSNDITYKMAVDTKRILKSYLEKYGDLIIEDVDNKRKLTDIEFTKSPVDPSAIKVELTWEPIFEGE